MDDHPDRANQTFPLSGDAGTRYDLLHLPISRDLRFK
jgi:hypothetical protein